MAVSVGITGGGVELAAGVVGGAVDTVAALGVDDGQNVEGAPVGAGVIDGVTVADEALHCEKMFNTHEETRAVSRQSPLFCGEMPHQLHARALEFDVHGEHALELLHGCAPAMANVASSSTAVRSVARARVRGCVEGAAMLVTCVFGVPVGYGQTRERPGGELGQLNRAWVEHGRCTMD